MKKHYIIVEVSLIDGNSLKSDFRGYVLQGADAGFRTFFATRKEAEDFLEENGKPQRHYIIQEVLTT